MRSRRRAIYAVETHPSGPASAREIVATELSALMDRDTLEDVKLMVSELVTNGILYGRAGPPRLALDLCIDGAVRCSITDQGPESSGPRGRNWRQGMGLWLVEQLALSWGVKRTADATQVWFETDPE